MAKADIIYFDMPWEYTAWNNETGSGRSAQKHYFTHPVEQFYDLPMLEAANKDALLFGWVTYPHLPDLFKLVEAWNEQTDRKSQKFKFATVGFTWAKLNTGWRETARSILSNGATDRALDELIVRIFANGIGYYTMSNPEIVCVFKRGNLGDRLERVDKTVRNFQAFPRGVMHSEKPDEINAMIDRLFPKASKLELFARRQYPDPRWSCLGRVISGRDIHDDLRDWIDDKKHKPSMTLF